MGKWSDKSYVGLGGCPVCGKDSGVLINQRLLETFEHGKRYSLLCADCEKHIKAGVVFLVEVTDETPSGSTCPDRTGYLVGISKEAAARLGIKGYMAYVHRRILKDWLGEAYGKEVNDEQGQAQGDSGGGGGPGQAEGKRGEPPG
jgi:hypothetical protein